MTDCPRQIAHYCRRNANRWAACFLVFEFINYEDPPKPLIYYYEELKNPRHQLACIASSSIADEGIINNSEMTVEEVYTRCFPAFDEENA